MIESEAWPVVGPAEQASLHGGRYASILKNPPLTRVTKLNDTPSRPRPTDRLERGAGRYAYPSRATSPAMGRYGTGDEAFFDRVARLYDGVMPPARNGSLAAAFRFADRPIRRVLDAAGGTGRAARAVRETTDASVTVCDISAGMLARAVADGFEAVCGDARRLPIRTGSLDAAVIVDALHHVPDPATALGELVRVLAPGGVVVVRDFDPKTAIGRAIAVSERFVGMNSALLGPAAVVRALRDAGARAYTIDGGWTYTVVGVRPRSKTTDRAGEVADTPANGRDQLSLHVNTDEAP